MGIESYQGELLCYTFLKTLLISLWVTWLFIIWISVKTLITFSSQYLPTIITDADINKVESNLSVTAGSHPALHGVNLPDDALRMRDRLSSRWKEQVLSTQMDNTEIETQLNGVVLFLEACRLLMWANCCLQAPQWWPQLEKQCFLFFVFFLRLYTTEKLMIPVDWRNKHSNQWVKEFYFCIFC